MNGLDWALVGIAVYLPLSIVTGFIVGRWLAAASRRQGVE